MTPLYVYSLIPVLSVSLLLFLSLLLYGRSLRGLTCYCGAVALWTAVLVSLAFPNGPEIGRRLAQVGAFVAAAFIHTAYDFTRQRNYAFVWFVYAVAAAITLLGVFWPGLLYAPTTLEPGPAYWPVNLLSVAAAAIPLLQIARAYPSADAPTRRQLRTLAFSGALGSFGAMLNSFTLTHGMIVPYPMLLVLASLLLLTSLLRQAQQAAGRQLLDRSLLYAAMTAFLWAGFLFGAMTLMNQSAEPLLRQYRFGAFFLLCMAALAFEPARQHVQQLIGRRLLRRHVGSHELAEQLAQQEQRADQAERLAEIGTFVSAVAHEIRNPLGVIAANLRLLESGAPQAEVLNAVRNQVERASTFVDDLLQYGRPRPLELRLIDVANTIRLAHSTVIQGEPDAASITWDGLDRLPNLIIEADQGQIMQVMIILLANAVHTLEAQPRRVCRVRAAKQDGEICIGVDDNGTGIPEALRGRLFEPFVSGRKRQGKHTGTGLGLAIAKGIVERHQGSLRVAPGSELGGASFEVHLPMVQRIVPAA